MNPEGVIEQLQDWANLLSQQLLAIDPICSQRLAKLAGQSVEVECIQPKFTCYADITDQGIQVRAGSAIAPNVQLRGHASELLKRALANDSQAAVEVNGDETLLLELVNILTNFRPDPAPALAKVVGDDRAQSLTALFELGADTAMKFARKQVWDIKQTGKDTMRANFTGTSDLNQLQDQLDQMRLQIDRVSARLERLEHTGRNGG